MSYFQKRQSYHQEIRKQHQQNYINSIRKQLTQQNSWLDIQQYQIQQSKAVNWLHNFIIRRGQHLQIQDLYPILLKDIQQKCFVKEIIQLDFLPKLVQKYQIRMVPIATLIMKDKKKQILKIIGQSKLPNLIIQELIKLPISNYPEHFLSFFQPLQIHIEHLNKTSARELLNKLKMNNFYSQIKGFIQLIGLLFKFSYFPNYSDQKIEKYAQDCIKKSKYSCVGQLSFFYLVDCSNFGKQDLMKIIKMLYQMNYDEQIILICNAYFYKHNNLFYQDLRSYLIRPIKHLLFNKSIKTQMRNFCLKILTNAFCNGLMSVYDIIQSYFEDYQCQSLYRLCFDMHITKQYYYLLKITLKELIRQTDNRFYAHACMLKEAAIVLIRSKRIQLKDKIKLIKLVQYFEKDIDQFQQWIAQYQQMKRQSEIIEQQNSEQDQQLQLSQSHTFQQPQEWIFQNQQ